ncbi:MAG: anhydro-N-acetylmuramic acid kinase, partial [Bacteroidales bacterium]|nr:anhydro-N-acetylmuramic acid kinase [Bacteroidales bacterium]
MMSHKISVIGLMSGTSLDGLDICYVKFVHEKDKWSYEIEKAESRDYPEDLKNKLATAQSMSALEFARLHSDYGLYLGKEVADFIRKNGIHPDIIASHGQTIFHQPEVRFTSQIGSGAGIAAETGVDTVCDFRTTDVALGGQGAPLVPIGDRTLFSEYSFCLNLGGFSNISFDKDGSRNAFDISPVNYVMNHYTRKIGEEFDRDGERARRGKINESLLGRLNDLPFYKAEGP